MKYFAIALASAALTGAQTPAISIGPNTAGLGGRDLPVAGAALAGSRISVPILGYIAGPGPLDLRAIVGTAKTARLGPPITLPASAKHIFMPPREHYVLLEGSASEPLAVWLPTRSNAESTPVSGAMPHPDIVAFSARGEAAALYAKTGDRLQVINGLPGEAVVTAQPGVGKLGEPATFAVSDDGAVVLVQLADGRALTALRGAAWQRLPVADGARTVLFVPKTHNLVVSDTAQQALTLLANVGDKPQGALVGMVSGEGVEADRLAFTKEGGVLLAASSSHNKLWTVDLKTMTPAPASATAIDTLLPLRDGHTFLLSSPGLSLLNVSVDRDSAVGFVPVTR